VAAVALEQVVINFFKWVGAFVKFFALTCLKRWYFYFALTGFAGCAPSTVAVIDTLGLLAPRSDFTLNAVLDPARRYLRVTSNGRPLLMVLGYEESGFAGSVQVWYSRGAEVLRLSHDRIVGLLGTPVELMALQTEHFPDWSRDGMVQFYVRQRNLMPGYRYGLTDRVSVRAAQNAQPKALVLTPELQGRTLYWFEEHYAEVSPTSFFKVGKLLPSSLFAVIFDDNQRARVVYSEQCISFEFCLTLQAWGTEQ
jgi:hypothetical protein